MKYNAESDDADAENNNDKQCEGYDKEVEMAIMVIRRFGVFDDSDKLLGQVDR